MRIAIRYLPRITQIVNVLLVTVTLLVTSCGQPDSVRTPVDHQTIGQLNAVWATPATPKSIRDIAVVGGSAAIVAVAYDYAGLQIFDFNGDQLSDIAKVNVLVLADGRVFRFGDRTLTVFLGITTDSELKIYLFGAGLSVPVELDFPSEISGSVLGVCTETATDRGSPERLRMAFWTTENPLRPILGSISTVKKIGKDDEAIEEFIWMEEYWTNGVPIEGSEYSRRRAEPFGSCWYEPTPRDHTYKPRREPTSSRATTVFSRDGQSTKLILNESGRITAVKEGQPTRDYAVVDGISVQVPNRPTAISSLSYPTKGGYPNGAILLAGETSQGNSQVVFIDAGPLLESE